MKDTITLDGARISNEVMQACLAAMMEGKPILLTGHAGAGKSLLARRLGAVRGGPFGPFRSPHHTVSTAGMVGSTRYPTGGECARANMGTLFLDEMPEFPRATLEVIRTAYENKQIQHYDRESKTHLGITADFYLIMGANACPCGRKGSGRKCDCSKEQVERYHNRTYGFVSALDPVRIPVRMDREDGTRPVIRLA